MYIKRCPKSELLGKGMKMNFLKSKLVRISDIHCTWHKNQSLQQSWNWSCSKKGSVLVARLSNRCLKSGHFSWFSNNCFKTGLFLVFGIQPSLVLDTYYIYFLKNIFFAFQMAMAVLFIVAGVAGTVLFFFKNIILGVVCGVVVLVIKLFSFTLIQFSMLRMSLLHLFKL